MLSAFWLPFWQLCAINNAFHSVCLSVSHTHTQRRKWWKTVKVVVLKVGLCGRWWETVVTVELKNAKPRLMLALKWRIKKGINKAIKQNVLFIHLLIFFRNCDLFLAVKLTQWNLPLSGKVLNFLTQLNHLDKLWSSQKVHILLLVSLELHPMNTVAYCIFLFIITDCEPCWSQPAGQLMLTLEIKKDERFIWAPRRLVLAIMRYKKAMTLLWTLGYFAYRKFVSNRKSDSNMNPFSMQWNLFCLMTVLR